MTHAHTFEPAVPVHTYERIVEQIETAIVSGDIPVGSVLPSERELMVQFGVSRPTVREALRVLQSMGLLESRPGTRGGPIVLAPSPTSLERSFRNLIGTDALSLAEVVQFRVVLEGSACTLAALHRSDDDLARMEAAVNEMAAAARDNSEHFADADLRFHEAIWTASGNSVLRMSGQAVASAMLDLMQRGATAPGPDAERPSLTNDTSHTGDTSHTDDASHTDETRLTDAEAKAKREWAAIDRRLFTAIAERDSATAGDLARGAIIERFAPMLTATDREVLQALTRS